MTRVLQKAAAAFVGALVATVKSYQAGRDFFEARKGAPFRG